MNTPRLPEDPDEVVSLTVPAKLLIGVLTAVCTAGVVGGVLAWRDVSVLRSDLVSHHDGMTDMRQALEQVIDACRTNTVARERNEREIDRLWGDVRRLQGLSRP